MKTKDIRVDASESRESLSLLKPRVLLHIWHICRAIWMFCVLILQQIKGFSQGCVQFSSWILLLCSQRLLSLVLDANGSKLTVSRSQEVWNVQSCSYSLDTVCTNAVGMSSIQLNQQFSLRQFSAEEMLPELNVF